MVKSFPNLLQPEIDRVHEAGGGVVRVPPGLHETGTLFLRSRVELHLEPGAVLLGSRDPAAYSDAVEGFRDAVGSDRGRALIVAHHCEDVAITGGGTIDGQGAGFGGHRPMLLRFIDCRGVRVRDVRLKDSAAWVQHYLRCDDVLVSGVRVDSHANGNNDGINLDGCSRVRVSDCRFDCGDDALTLKCTTSAPCRDITITNCVLQSDCNGIKFGTESVGGFENITISNCVIHDTRLCGITVATVDGAFLRDVLISNITMRDVGCGLFVRLGSRGLNLPPGTNRPVGSLERVTIRDVQGRITGSHGNAVLGLPGHPIRDLRLENVHLLSPGGGTAEEALREVPEIPEEYPQFDKWGRLPAHGLFVRHVHRLTVRDFRSEPGQADARPATRFEKVTFSD